ncbi:MAG: hypothetical protein ACJ746_20115 [Bryobacteraceae bacterium]
MRGYLIVALLLSGESYLGGEILYSIRDLGTLGSSYSSALDLNNDGQVVGYSATYMGRYHAFLYSNGQMADLGSLAGGGGNSYGYGLNDAGR